MVGLTILIVGYIWWTLESVIDIRTTRKYNKECKFWWNEKGYNGWTIFWMCFTSVVVFAYCIMDALMLIIEK